MNVDEFVADLICRMTLDEKIGQMCQVDASNPDASDDLAGALREGLIGSIINQVDLSVVNELQHIAMEQSRLGIPLLVARDVIHGFKTIFPIPLGLAASWNPELVRQCSRIAATEAAASGVNWTFAPMIDIARDPRWGRIAESFGEDPYLTGILGVAAITGFQGDDLASRHSIATCAKHFAGYGAVESGRDYATTNIPEIELRNVYLRPFHHAVDAGVATLMASFCDLNGVPATANRFLMRDVLRDEWGFEGFVVSDWDSISQLSIHGLTPSDKNSALEAATAGIGMEMAGGTFRNHLANLVREGKVDGDTIDAAVASILRIKYNLGLFESPYVRADESLSANFDTALHIAKRSALESVVLLKNDGATLPINRDRIASLAVIGPLADAPYEQLGTWIFDAEHDLTVSGLEGIRKLAGDDVEIRYFPAMETSRSRSTESFDEVAKTAAESDAIILFLGEESILSGEAHSRADIGLPGAQAELVHRLSETGKPVILVILAGRPLTLGNVVDDVDAVLYAWHPGSMGGEAIAELLFGIESPSGKLPVTMPRMVGQIPIYYSQKNTGKPPSPETVVHIDDIQVRAPQTSLGMTAFHLDAGYTPQFPFGFGMSYTEFEYRNLRLSEKEIPLPGCLAIHVDVANLGDVSAEEVVQLYVRDLVGCVTRPVKELKGFRRIRIDPGENVTIEFQLQTEDLAFYGRDNTLVTEPGDFYLWVGGSSETALRAAFRVLDTDSVN